MENKIRKTILDKLLFIQQALNAPKNLHNDAGNFSYRSAEGILEALKPLLLEEECVLIMNDELVEVGGRCFIKAIVTLKVSNSDSDESISASAYAECGNLPGMTVPQTTGASSSYARKYALNGLFAIDDAKMDPDMTENDKRNYQKSQSKPQQADKKPQNNSGGSNTNANTNANAQPGLIRRSDEILIGNHKGKTFGEISPEEFKSLVSWAKNANKTYSDPATQTQFLSLKAYQPQKATA